MVMWVAVWLSFGRISALRLFVSIGCSLFWARSSTIVSSLSSCCFLFRVMYPCLIVTSGMLRFRLLCTTEDELFFRSLLSVSCGLDGVPFSAAPCLLVFSVLLITAFDALLALIVSAVSFAAVSTSSVRTSSILSLSPTLFPESLCGVAKSFIWPPRVESARPGVGYTIVLVAPLSTSLIWNRWFSSLVGLGRSCKNT